MVDEAMGAARGRFVQSMWELWESAQLLAEARLVPYRENGKHTAHITLHMPLRGLPAHAYA